MAVISYCINLLNKINANKKINASPTKSLTACRCKSNFIIKGLFGD